MSIHPDKLHIIVPYFNPFGWRTRKKLHEEFIQYIEPFGAAIYVVELVLGDHEFAVTTGQKNELQIRSNEVGPWIKENLINMGIRKLLPENAKYVAWIDGDIRFDNPNWVHDTLHKLQHSPIVQMFSECIDVGPNFQIVPHEKGPMDYVRNSFIKSHWNKTFGAGRPGSYDHEHCGYAWAARIGFLKKLDPFNPLLDCSLVGSADWQMACCFVGRPEKAAHGQASPGYKHRIDLFSNKCERHLRGNVSYVPGLVRHMWHGRKSDRKYVSRWSIVVDTKFDPDYDLTYREDGLLIFSGRNPQLPLLLRAHGEGKNEDSIDVI